MESTSIQDYLDCTQNWQNIFVKQNPQEISSYLKPNVFFSITRKEYNKMKGLNPNELHYYLGIRDGRLVILVINDVSDKKGDHNHVFVKELREIVSPAFQKTIESKLIITKEEALMRMSKWNKSSIDWIKDRVNNFKDQRGDVEAFYPLIKNQFECLKILFENDNRNEVCHFFGLQQRTDDRLSPICYKLKDDNTNTIDFSKHNLDIVITNFCSKIEEVKENVFVNVSWPWEFPINASNDPYDLNVLKEILTSNKHSLLPKFPTKCEIII